MLPNDGSVELVKASKSLKVGEEVQLRLQFGIFSILWIAKHIVFVKDCMFEDIQKKGPFNIWKQRHLFQELDQEKTLLRDEISLSLPFKKWTHPLFSNLILSLLKNVFKERHEILLKEFTIQNT